MSNYAFEDKERKRKIYAKQAIKNNTDKLYYCPNPFCEAHLYLCSVDGSTTPYFRATKKDFPHSDDCFYRRCLDFNADNVKETEFNFDDIINDLLKVSTCTESGKVGENYTNNLNENIVERIKTLRQLYLFLKSKDVQERYNNFTIGLMLLDSRSLSMNSKGVFGSKIIESQFKSYDKEKYELKFKVVNNENYVLILKFANEDVFRNIKSIVYSNRDKIFILAGNWKKKLYNCFYSDFIDKKQLYILK